MTTTYNEVKGQQVTKAASSSKASSIAAAPTNGNEGQLFPSASLYVGDLSLDVTEAILYEIFNTIGPVASIRVCRDSITRKSLGYAYVNYHTVNDARRALEALKYNEICGKQVRIMWSHRDPSLRKSGAGNVFIKNIDESIDTKALYDAFSPFGQILSCKVATDETGRSRGYGFVHFDTEANANRAISDANGLQLGNKKIFVAPFIRRSERTSSTKFDEGVDDKFTNLYIRNFPDSWDEEALKENFSPFGEITSMMIKSDPLGRKFAFVNYVENSMAKAAIDAMNGKDLSGDKSSPDGEDADKSDTKLLVCAHQDRARRHAMLKAKYDSMHAENKSKYQGVNLYIKNLDDSINDAELRKLFEGFGMITSCKVMVDEHGASLGFGFVCFVSPEDATHAVSEMHLKLVHNKPLYVGLAEKREQRLNRLQMRYKVGHSRDGMPMGMMPPHGMMPPMHMAMPIMPINGHYMYPAPAIHAPASSQQNAMMPYQWRHQYHPGIPPMGMQVPFNARGAAMPVPMRVYNPMGSRGSRGQNVPVQKLGQNGDKGMGDGFKFTPQARNRMEMVQTDHSDPATVGNARTHGRSTAPVSAVPGRDSNDTTFQEAHITAATLAAAHPNMQKQMLGEKLFPIIARHNPELAGKVTGMMLEMDNSELLILLESEKQLIAKADEAIRVLQQAR